MIFLSTLLGSAAPMGCGQDVFFLHEEAQPSMKEAVPQEQASPEALPANIPELQENKTPPQKSKGSKWKDGSPKTWRERLRAKFAVIPAAGLDLG